MTAGGMAVGVVNERISLTPTHSERKPAMKNRPLIGINTDSRASAKGRALHSFMHSGYYDCLLSANAVPVMIPPLIKEHDLAPILDHLDGADLSGRRRPAPQRAG